MVAMTFQTRPKAEGPKRSAGSPAVIIDKQRVQELAKRDFRAATDFQAAIEYATDFWQRSLLFLDILRQSGNQQAEMTSRPINAVAIYDYEYILRGTNLPRPVNYALVRVVPPRGTVIDHTKRPVVVIDPRAGQGPGIGGFKPASEIGNAFKAGHPVYFIGFMANPVEGQTIEDVAHAFTVFLQKVIDLEPGAIGKPFVFGNCQAGWHALMAACIRPELFGPIVAAGAPLSYWGGVRGKNPMRYSGGLLGGTWTARLASDLGGGFLTAPGWSRTLIISIPPIHFGRNRTTSGRRRKRSRTASSTSRSGGGLSCGSAARNCNIWSTTCSSGISSRLHRS